MKKRLTKKEKRRVFLTGIFCFLIIGISIITSYDNISKIKEKTDEKKALSRKLEELKDEEVTLTDDVEKLKNPEYAARYAREKYLYSKNGEKIIKMD